MTPGEITAYNQGVMAVLDLASRTARSIAATTRRPIAEGFAVAALEELAAAGNGLLLRPQAEQKEAA